MARQLRPKEDALFVEGPDDMAVVNALVKVPLGLDIGRPVELARKPLSQTGGLEAAIAGFERRVRERKAGAHVGLLIDRDATMAAATTCLASRAGRGSTGSRQIRAQVAVARSSSRTEDASGSGCGLTTPAQATSRTWSLLA